MPGSVNINLDTAGLKAYIAKRLEPRLVRSALILSREGSGATPTTRKESDSVSASIPLSIKAVLEEIGSEKEAPRPWLESYMKKLAPQIITALTKTV